MGMGGGTVRPPVMRVGATVRAPPGAVSLSALNQGLSLLPSCTLCQDPRILDSAQHGPRGGPTMLSN